VDEVKRAVDRAFARALVVPVVLLTVAAVVLCFLVPGPRAAAQAPKDDVAWEEVSGPRGVAVWRSRTPGGWLVVQSPGNNACVAAYVPDPDHGWGRARPDLPEAQPR
jgi:hypothetical protein